MAKRMTPLEVYAQRGSISYAGVRPERLRAILLGDDPKESEIASIEQALLETAATGLHRDLAAELADELGVTLDRLNARCQELTGEQLGSSVHSVVAQLIEVGLAARYRNDLDGLNRTRQAVRDELLTKGWVLPPFTSEADFQ